MLEAAFPYPVSPLPTWLQKQQHVMQGFQGWDQSHLKEKILMRAHLHSWKQNQKHQHGDFLILPQQLKKGNKEPNPMVQLSIQDMTQESKVRARTSLWDIIVGNGMCVCAHTHLVGLGRIVLEMKSPL